MSTQQTTGQTETQAPPQDPIGNRREPATASAIAERLTRRDLGTGDLAELRRMNTDRPDSALFWRLIIAFRIASDDSAYNDDVQTEQAWAKTIAALAHGTRYGQEETTTPHDPAIPLGRALAAAGFHQARLQALLNAGPPQVQRLAATATAFLHSKGQRYNAADLARLMLSPLRSKAQRDADRTYLARHFNREIYRQSQQAGSQD